MREMTFSEIGRQLGLSKSHVQRIERDALEKLAALFGFKLAPRPFWMMRKTHRRNRCGRCGARGHCRTTCARSRGAS